MLPTNLPIKLYLDLGQPLLKFEEFLKYVFRDDAHEIIVQALTGLFDHVVDWCNGEGSLEIFVADFIFTCGLSHTSAEASAMTFFLFDVVNRAREQIQQHQLLEDNVFPYVFQTGWKGVVQLNYIDFH
jgi:hypothetical protein